MQLTGNVQGLIDLVGGSDVEVTPILGSGTKIATIEVDGVSYDLYAPTPETPEEVSVTPVLESGTKIGTISVGDNSYDLYAPTPETPAEVSVNPILESGTKIATISVGDNSYDIYAPEGGGGGITYSTSQEVDTGDKWTDGKTIYARAYYFSEPYNISSTWKNTTINTSNIGRVIEMYCSHADGSYYGIVDCDITRNNHTTLAIRTAIGANVASILLKYTHRN